MVETSSDTPFVFLETTIQIDRIIGTQEQRDTIRRNLRGHRLTTSGHVLNEFNKTLLRDALTFRDLLQSSPDVGEAVKRLSRYSRKYARTVDLLATLGFENDKQVTIERLEDFIEWRAEFHFWDSIDRGDCTDDVGCVLKDWVPVQDETGNYDLNSLKCLKQSPPPCAVLQFIEERSALIGNFVATSNQSSNENVRKAGQALENILDGLDSPYGERSNCYLIADTMIVLESRSDSEVYSKDGDVREICGLLGRRSYMESEETPA